MITYIIYISNHWHSHNSKLHSFKDLMKFFAAISCLLYMYMLQYRVCTLHYKIWLHCSIVCSINTQNLSMTMTSVNSVTMIVILICDDLILSLRHESHLWYMYIVLLFHCCILIWWAHGFLVVVLSKAFYLLILLFIKVFLPS